MSTVFYCLSNNPRANIPTPILNMSTLITQVVQADNIIKRVYVYSDISGNQPISIGSQVDPELIVPYSANVHLLINNKGCMYNPTIAYSMVADTELYLTSTSNIDGVVSIMVEIEEIL